MHARRLGTRATLLALALAATVLVGCSGPGGGGGDAPASDLGPEEAEQRAENALADFQASLADPIHGDLKGIEGTFTAPLEPGNPAAGTQEVDLVWEWGSNDVVHMRLTTDAPEAVGADTVAVWCSPGRMVFQFGDAVFEATDEGGQDCLHADEAGDDPLAFAEKVPGFDTDVEAHPDGSVTATYRDGEGNVGTFHVDAAGRLTEVDVEGPEYVGHLVVVYGEREPIEVPEASGDLGDLFEGLGNLA